MTEETRLIYKRLQNDFQNRFPALGTWEVKNLAAGRDVVMHEILNFKNGPFDWTTCKVPRCKSLSNHKREIAHAKALLSGPDAKTTPWNILPAMGLGLQVGTSGSNFPSTLAKRKNGDVSVGSDSRIHGMLFIIPQEYSTPLQSRLRQSTIKQSSQSMMRSHRLKPSMPPPPPSIKGKERAVDVEDEDEDAEEDDDDHFKGDPSHKDKSDLTAQDIVQQVRKHQCPAVSYAKLFRSRHGRNP